MPTEDAKLDKVLEIITDMLTALESLAVDAKKRISEIENMASERETSFTILAWESKKGDRLGEFEIATKERNDPEKYRHALDVLKANNASIEDRFYEPLYLHTYWTYQDTIYRQARKQN